MYLSPSPDQSRNQIQAFQELLTPMIQMGFSLRFPLKAKGGLVLLTGQSEEPVGVRAQAQTRASLLPRPPFPEQPHPCRLSSFWLNSAPTPHTPQLLHGPPKGRESTSAAPQCQHPSAELLQNLPGRNLRVNTGCSGVPWSGTCGSSPEHPTSTFVMHISRGEHSLVCSLGYSRASLIPHGGGGGLHVS